MSDTSRYIYDWCKIPWKLHQWILEILWKIYQEDKIINLSKTQSYKWFNSYKDVKVKNLILSHENIDNSSHMNEFIVGNKNKWSYIYD